MQKLSCSRVLYAKPAMYQNRYAPRLARLHRARGRRPAFAAGQSNLRAALTDNRTRLCGREGKTRDALYTLSRADCGNRMGQAQICCDESQETCHPQVSTFLPLPVFFMLEAPLLHCNGFFLSFTGFASRIRSRAAKSAKYENLWVFIRSDAHVVRAGLNIRGCGPLSTLGFFDRLRGGIYAAPFARWLGVCHRRCVGEPAL